MQDLMNLLGQGEIESILKIAQSEDDPDIMQYEKDTIDRMKLPEINQRSSSLQAASEYQDNQVTDYTQNKDTKGLLTNNQSRDQTNVMYFPQTSDAQTVNNSFTYHAGAKNRNMFNNKFGGVTHNNNTRYINQVNKYYLDAN